mgnify:CR=1 FL=1
MTIKVNELGVPLSPNTPRLGNWCTIEGEDETVIIRVINYSDASIEVEHMDGKRTHHFFRDIIYISKEYYDSSE